MKRLVLTLTLFSLQQLLVGCSDSFQAKTIPTTQKHSKGGGGFNVPINPIDPVDPVNPGGGEPILSCDAEAVVRAERAKYNQPTREEILDLLKTVARTLNQQNCANVDFGILRKSGGNQCGGYSCDVICAGQGNEQHQWDVLRDAGGTSDPTWSHIEGSIRIDVCEIQ